MSKCSQAGRSILGRLCMELCQDDYSDESEMISLLERIDFHLRGLELHERDDAYWMYLKPERQEAILKAQLQLRTLQDRLKTAIEEERVVVHRRDPFQFVRGHGVLHDILATFNHFLAIIFKPMLFAGSFASTFASARATAPEGSAESSKAESSNFAFGVIASIGVLVAIITLGVAIMHRRRSSRTLSTPRGIKKTRRVYIEEENVIILIEE